jgi:hypothetical protein
MSNDRRLCAGDRVLVRSPEEILATLDGNGALDGVPFMPEMLDWCGKPFHIQRRVEKTCVADYMLRRFPANDVVVLDGPRCDGEGHDGCKHGCRIYWKEAWLRRLDTEPVTTGRSERGLESLRARLKVKSDEQHYFCQSTELLKTTEAFPGKQKPWTVRILFREIGNGDITVSEAVKCVARWSWQRFRRVTSGDGWLRGPNKRTPTASLGLQPGETVRIKTRAEVVATLDHKRRNRGMGICYEVLRNCGSEAEVRFRVDKLIDERDGKMLTLPDTVALKNVRNDQWLSEECLCFDELGDCPRGELMYWREIWLERVKPAGTSG